MQKPMGSPVLALALVLILAACAAPAPSPVAPGSVDGSSRAPASSAAPTSVAPTSVAPTSAAPTSAAPTSAMGRRCGRPDAESSVAVLKGPDSQQLAVATVGSGPNVAVLLHQTGRSASCGWWPYAVRLAAAGTRAVLVDLCGYGTSECDPQKPWSADYPAQVKLVVEAVRAAGAQRVTLVGASMGGALAAVSAAPTRADAVVVLSSGAGFAKMEVAPALAGLTIPVFGAGSEAEEPDTQALADAVQASASPTKRFTRTAVGHGWDMVLDGPLPDAPLTPLGTTIIEWVRGNTVRG